MIASLQEQCKTNADGVHIICLQDTSEYNYQRHFNRLRKESLGIVGNNIDHGFFAHVMLCFDTKFVYNEPIYIPKDEPLKKAITKKANKPLTSISYLKISPNPANEYITVLYNINGTVNGLRLFITDAMGKTIYEKEMNKAIDEQYNKNRYNKCKCCYKGSTDRINS